MSDKTQKDKYDFCHKIFHENFLYIILLLLSLMIITLCRQDTINYDEYFSMEWCRFDWSELIKTIIGDVHPPLYYFILKPILGMTNESMFFARLLSAAASIFLLWMGSLFLKRNYSQKSALLFACFLFLNPFMIQKSTEIRMYAIAGTFVVISGILSHHILKEQKRKDWILFTVFSLLAAYTHYYALLAIFFLYVGILIYFIALRHKKGLLDWLLYSVIIIIGYLPWLPTLYKQITSVNQNFWISIPSSRLAPLKELFYTMIPYTEWFYLGIIVILSVISFLIFIQKRTPDNYWPLMCCGTLWGSFLLTSWYSSHIRPILLSRYLIMSICLATIGISTAVRLCNKYIIIIICLCCSFIGGRRYIDAVRTQNNRNTTKTLAFAEDNFEQNDLIVYSVSSESDNGYFGLCVKYYFPNVRCINIEKPQMEQLVQLLETEDSLWFLDVNQLLLENKSFTGSLTMENCGSYGFSSVTFDIFKIE